MLVNITIEVIVLYNETLRRRIKKKKKKKKKSERFLVYSLKKSTFT